MPKPPLKVSAKKSETPSMSSVDGRREKIPSISGISVFEGDKEPENVGRHGPKHSISSFTGLMASKRFAKRLTSHFLSSRQGSIASCSRISKPLSNEPTYRMEPRQKFQVGQVREIVEEVVKERLNVHQYNVENSSRLCSMMSESIKEKVKRLNYDRYRIIAVVMIGEDKGQGVMVSSRCTWDEKRDDYVTFSYKRKGTFCTATVYGIYTE